MLAIRLVSLRNHIADTDRLACLRDLPDLPAQEDDITRRTAWQRSLSRLLRVGLLRIEWPNPLMNRHREFFPSL